MSEAGAAPVTPSAPQAPPQTAPEAPDTGAPDAALPDKPTAAEIRKWKLKVDGAEVEVDEAELTRGYERAKGSHKRFEEANKLRKEVEAREADFAKTVDLVRNPATSAKALTRLLGEEGLYKLAESVIMQRLELDAMPEPERKRRAQMTERERQIEAEEQRIAAREAEVKRRQEADLQRQAQEHQARFTKEWPGLLREAGVPPSRHAMQRMASTMRTALDNGIDMTEREVAQTVAEELRAEYAEMGQDPATLTKLLGPAADKVRQATIDATANGPGRRPPAEQPAPRAPRPTQEPLTLEALRKKYAR